MKTRPVDPTRLDVASFARDGGTLEGQTPLMSLERLSDSTHPDARPTEADMAHWTAKGENRPVRGGQPEVWLHVAAQATVSLVCQRCLSPVEAPLDAHRSFHFVSDETTAAQLDADSEDDVLALTRSLNLVSLVEDELLLALPLVPRHEVCPEPLPMSHGDDEEGEEEAAPNPFAALAALKRGGPPN